MSENQDAAARGMSITSQEVATMRAHEFVRWAQQRQDDIPSGTPRLPSVPSTATQKRYTSEVTQSRQNRNV